LGANTASRWVGWITPRRRWRRAIDGKRYSAIQLFVQGARRALPGFQLTRENLDDVVRICRLVDGMPQGIRLAAAWVALFKPAEIADQIEQSIDILETGRSDVPERQRSMRATFDHSWELLGAREREIFPALSVFRGGFTSEAALAVAGATPRELMTLVEKSLVDSDGRGRFQTHELLRSYAVEKLATRPNNEFDVRARHCNYYTTALERWGVELKGHRQLSALAEIDLEIDNARAAWDWAVDQGQIEGLGRAMGGCFISTSGGAVTWMRRQCASRRQRRSRKAVRQVRCACSPGSWHGKGSSTGTWTAAHSPVIWPKRAWRFWGASSPLTSIHDGKEQRPSEI
jgi:predicted ATPase